MRGVVQHDAAGTAPWHARIVRGRPSARSMRRLHEGEARFIRHYTGCATDDFVVGMSIVSQGG